MTPISVRASADGDIDAAIDHYNDHDLSVAPRFVDELEATFRRISRNPRIGSPRFAELTSIDGLRSLRMKGFDYHVFYIELRQAVVIVRVLHERRDIPAALSDA